MAKRLFSLSLMIILATTAWADVTLTGRTATNELFRLERQGADNTYFISGGTLTYSALASASSVTDFVNAWRINAKDRYLSITLPSALEEGDVITLTGGYEGNTTNDRGFRLLATAPAEDTDASIFMGMDTGYSKETLGTATYTVTTSDLIIGKSTIYIGRTGATACLKKVIVTRTGADDMVPNAVSNKTWDLYSLAQTNNRSSSVYGNAAIIDDLYFAKGLREFKQSSSPLIWGVQVINNTSGVPDFTKDGLAFVAESGKKVITVYWAGTAHSLVVSKGSSKEALEGTSGTADENYGTPVYYTYECTYDTPFFVTKSGGNTTITKIVVAPESVTTPTIEKTGKNEYKVTPGTSNGGSAVTVSTYYTTDGTTPTNSSTALPNDGKITITDGVTQIQVISISDFDAQSAVASQSVSFEPETTDISSAIVTLSQNSFPYTGEAQAPSVTSVVLNEVTLNAETDYDVNTITSQTNIGNEYTVSVTGKGNYTGTATATWAIRRGEGSISFANTSGSVAMGTTDFSVVVTKVGDGTVTYSSGDTSIATIDESSGLVTPVSAGITTITATVNNGTNYDYATTTATYELTVTDSSPAVTEISNVNITGLSAPVKGEALTTKEGLTTTTEGVSISSINWSPEATTAAASTEYTATIVMEAASGYQFASEVSVNAISEKDATITRNSDTQISVAYTFDATAADAISISGAVVNLSNTSFTYTGSEQAPAVNSVVLNETTLTANDDYIVEITSQTNVGNYTVTVTGTGSFTGTATANWSIIQAAGSISYTTTSVSKTVGNAAFVNELTHTGDGTVTYSIDPTSVATINESTGEITIVGAGTATVTATVANGTNYNYAETTATYTLDVSAAELSNPTLTIATELTGGTIAAKAGDSGINSSAAVSAGTQVTLTATPNAGYQLKNWKSGDDVYGDLPKSLVQTITMPENNLSITAEFEAQPATAPSITTSKTWIFGDDYAVGTKLSYQQVYNYDGLYITGHNATTAAEIETGGTEVGTTIDRHVKIPGKIGSISSSTKANDAVSNAIALNIGKAGTITAVVKGTSTDRYFNFYVKGASTGNITQTNTVQEISQVINGSDVGPVFLGTNNGKMELYSITFTPATTYQLTVTQPETGGTIKIGDNTAETQEYVSGTEVTLTAEPASGYRFGFWTVDGVQDTEHTTNTLTLTMKAAHSVTATFEAGEETVSEAKTWTFDNTAAYPTTELRGINVNEKLYSRSKSNGGRGFKFAETDETGSLKFSNDNVEFTVSRMAIATNSGNINSSDNTISTAGQGSTNDEINNVNPYFAFNAAVPGTLYVLMKGFVANSDQTNALAHTTEKSTSASSCRIYFTSGSNVVGANGTEVAKEAGTDDVMELSYTSTKAGSFFVGSQNNTCQIYAIRFVPTPTYTVKATAGEGGSVSIKDGANNAITSGNKVTKGTKVILTATPDTENNYVFKNWTSGSTVISTDAEYTINSLDADIDYTANFEEATSTSYLITVPAAVNGNSVTASAESATAGTTITLTITTAANYTLTSISATGVTLNGSDNTRAFTMPAANVTITASWKEKTTESSKTEVTENVDIIDTSHATVTSVEVGDETTSITISGSVSDGTNNVPVTTIAVGTFTADNTANVQSIDLSKTQVTLTGARSSNLVLKDIPANTLVYLPSTSSEVTGDNVIIYDGDGTEATDYTCSNFVMTDTKSYSVPQPFTATNATLSRSFTSGVTCTVCLPYDVPAGNLDGNIYQFSEVNGTTVKMTQKEGGLVANTPYIFVPSGNVTQITATSVTINMSGTPNTSPDGQSFTFKGVFEHKDFTTDEISDGIYGFAADADHGAASVGQFVKASNGAWTEGMRAYLEYSEGDLTGTASTRGEGLPDVLNVVLIHANGSTTNIGRLELMTAEDGSPVYNLNGQRVDNSYKGLVIKNGKKVVKK